LSFDARSGAKYTAFKWFALVRRLFNWAIGTDDYGLESNPCDRLDQGDVIGERESRDRVMSDDEIRALWAVTERLGYPYGPLYRLLLLTGLRLNEACGATWNEIDLDKREWTVPAARMKKVKGGAKPHLVPLTDAMVGTLKALPRFERGKHLFSNSFGGHPLKPNHFSDIKARLNRELEKELGLPKAAMDSREDDDERNPLAWVNHDLRRTVRTRLSRLKIADEVREAVLAHVRPGIKKVYDLYEYDAEKREALELWNAALRDLVMPRPENVVSIRKAAQMTV
jgi:integrase